MRPPTSVMVGVAALLMAGVAAQEAHAGDGSPPNFPSPCSISTKAFWYPVYYGGEPRFNPDDTLYPGDGFNFIIQWRGLQGCIKMSVSKFETSGSYAVLDATQKLHGRSRDARPSHTGAPPGPQPCDGASQNCSFPFMDKSSFDDFRKELSAKCGSSRHNHGCIYGHVQIDVGHRQAPCHQDCDEDHSMEVKIKAFKRVCVRTPEGVKCKLVQVTSSGHLSHTVLDPTPKITFTNPILKDLDMLPSRNLDGSYYAWDTPTVFVEPEIKFEEERKETITFDTEGYRFDIEEIYANQCQEDACFFNVSTPYTTDEDIPAIKGDSFFVYRPEGIHKLGIQPITYDMKVLNLDRMISNTFPETSHFIVDYKPEFHEDSYQYTVLDTPGKTSKEKQKAIALHYEGSHGTGPDDDGQLHPERRAKVNTANVSTALFTQLPIPRINITVAVTGVDTLNELKHTVRPSVLEVVNIENSTYPSTEISRFLTIFQLEREGVARVTVDYKDDLDEYWSFVSLGYTNTTLSSTDFGGYNSTILKHTGQIIPQAQVTSHVDITAYGADGTPDDGTTVYAELRPAFNPNNTMWLPDYMYGHIVNASIVPHYEEDLIDFDPGPGNVNANYSNARDILYDPVGQKHFPDRLHVEDQNLARAYGLMFLADSYQIHNSLTSSGSFQVPINKPIVFIVSEIGTILNVTDRHLFTRFSESTAYSSISVYHMYINASRDGRWVNNTLPVGTYSFIDSKDFELNMRTDNVLEYSTLANIAHINAGTTFGEIVRLTVDGVEYPYSCKAGCSVKIPHDIQVNATNIWGGMASALIMRPAANATEPPYERSAVYFFENVLPEGVAILLIGAVVIIYFAVIRGRTGVSQSQ